MPLKSFDAKTIGKDLFDKYTETWKKLLDGTEATTAARQAELQQLFQAADNSQSLLNFAYLPSGQLVELLSAVGTAQICTQLAVVDEGGATMLGIVLYGISEDREPTSGYYLAGMTGTTAAIHPDATDNDLPQDSTRAPATNRAVSQASPARFKQLTRPRTRQSWRVPIGPLENWVQNWEAATPAELDLSWFYSLERWGWLHGYTYELSDFLNLLLVVEDSAYEESGESEEASGSTDVAASTLWLNFVLHEYTRPGETAAKPLFGLVLSLNNAPGDSVGVVMSSSSYFYDISRPCPPVCGKALATS